MNRIEIIDKLNNFILPNEEFWVSGGAALVLHNVKNETRDIDLGCSRETFDYYFGNLENKVSRGSRICKIDERIEIIENWNVDSIMEIEGFFVATLESVIAQKKKLGRAKDYEDIQLINEYLNDYHKE